MFSRAESCSRETDRCGVCFLHGLRAGVSRSSPAKHSGDILR